MKQQEKLRVKVVQTINGYDPELDIDTGYVVSFVANAIGAIAIILLDNGNFYVAKVIGGIKYIETERV